MGHLIKGLPLLFALSLSIVCLLTITFLFSAEPVFAQTPQKPSAPEFSLKFIPASETITHTDPYTGEKTYEIVDTSTIEVKIKNQSFKEKINGVKYYLFYTVSVQGHFAPVGNNIDSYYTFRNYSFEDFPKGHPDNMLQASTSGYTTISIKGDYSPNAQIDVGVTAMLMHDGEFRKHFWLGDLEGYLTAGVVEGEINYSAVQIFTIPDHPTSDDSTSPTVTITPPPNGNSFVPTEKDGIISMPLATFTVVIVAFISIITLLLTLILFKIRKSQ
jgi:hypothetical protein